MIDPKNSIDGQMDVAISDGNIAEVTEHIPVEAASHRIGVSGLLVALGLIDIHAYVNRQHHGPGFFVGSLNADAHFLSGGATTAVETGTAGAEEIGHFRESVMEKTICRVLAYVNISSPGMGDVEQNIRAFDVEAAARAASDNTEFVVGIKTAHYWTREPFDDVQVFGDGDVAPRCDLQIHRDSCPCDRETFTGFLVGGLGG